MKAKRKPLKPVSCRCGKVALFASTTGRCWNCDNRAANRMLMELAESEVA